MFISRSESIPGFVSIESKSSSSNDLILPLVLPNKSSGGASKSYLVT